MKNYVGITIGPIFDTIREASTPAALWYASSLFSDLTKRLCKEISVCPAFSGVEILSPYYGEDIRENDGVGKYHDRIFFSAEVFDENALKEIVAKVKRETAKNFPENLVQNIGDFFETYIQIHYIVLDESEVEGSVILQLSPYLDALELMKTFPKENTWNPIRKLFLGKSENSNQYIKDCRMFKDIENSQFTTRGKDGREKIWSIEDIACNHGMSKNGLKKENYYAMVQADGDGVGSFLKALSKEDAKVREFSKNCLKYDEAAAEMIGAFGGMTIYAGGDDLLFLAPVENTQGKTVFSLCHDIAKMFQEQVGGGPTLSFGISIQYKKFPLYEAYQLSYELLNTVKCNVEGKNSMAVNVQKHSGQSLGLVVANDSYEVLEGILKLGEAIKNPEEKVTSVIQVLETFRGLLHILSEDARTRTDKDAFRSAFMNLFDNPGQGAARTYLENVCDTYFDSFVTGKAGIGLMPEAAKELSGAEESVSTFIYLLRLKKFLCERGAEE